MLPNLRRYFITGLIIFLPLALTVYLFFLTINFADNFLGQFIQPYFYEQFGFYFHGVSIVIGVYLIILIGFFASNFFGKKIYDFFEKILIRLPFFRQVYPAIKEMAIFLFSRDQMQKFKQVVVVEYPRKGIYSYGFLTNSSSEIVGGIVNRELCNVFIPSAPGPLTGFAVMFPKEDIFFVDVNIEDAFKFILSGGVVNPPGGLSDANEDKEPLV